MKPLEEQIQVMPPLSYRGGELYMEEVRLSEIAAELGTPVYCYSKQEIVRRWQRLVNAFSGLDGSLLLAISLKANSNPELLRFLVPEGAGSDITSKGELAFAKAAGIPGERIVFAGIGKTSVEMRLALEAGILMFNVESEEEFFRLGRTSRQLGLRPPIGFRVNPNVDGYTHDLTTTGLYKNKFGIAADKVRGLIKAQAPDVIGLQVHIGSPIYDLGRVVHAFNRVVDLLRSLEGTQIRYLDLGGQIPIDYGDGKFDTQTSTPEYLANRVAPTLNELGVNLILEPGRFIFGAAGLILSEAIYTKENPEKRFLIVDTTMAQADRGPRYDAKHPVVPLRNLPERREVLYDVVGGVCESGDRQRVDVTLPEMLASELLAILCYGAYGYSMASNYNGQLRPPEVLVDGDSWRLIRRRETIEDLFRTLEVNQ